MDEPAFGRVGGAGPGRASGCFAFEGEGGGGDGVFGRGVGVPFHIADFGDCDFEGVRFRIEDFHRHGVREELFLVGLGVDIFSWHVGEGDFVGAELGVLHFADY